MNRSGKRDLYGDQFKEKVAIVTGAGGASARRTPSALAAEGAAVVVADINTEGAKKVADGSRATAARRSPSGRCLRSRIGKEMAAATAAEFGGIDYLVNNAAIFGGMKLDFLITVDWDYYKRFMSVNLDGALLCTRAVYRKMAKRGGGAIVNQSSTAAWLYSGFYGLAKVGINGLTQQLATELGGRTSASTRSRPVPSTPRPTGRRPPRTWWPTSSSESRSSRMGEPEDLVGMCLFLLSDQAKWITGQIFNVDGGQIIRS